ncbi:uncharacterized protein LOC127709241 isoform X2 [Mytilus californianus]|uniref:uncharacterized protein LOC127709241 isoform X2 n=1 Tax=Mytilus californianus TaxID=6549 RepID=UPI002246F080|nr:uncharacterized protein LOC127709241 isoform X2 [Mytilus californianus]
MVGLMSVWKLIFLILWSIGFLIFTSCVKAPTYEFDLQLYQVDESLLECPTGWLKFRNQCYYIVNEEATFQQADILCKRYGGHLVKTDGYNSNQGFGKLISNHNISHVWIGLQRKKSGEFWWSNGQLAEAADGFWTTQLPIQSTEYDLCTVMTTTLSDYGEYRWTLNNCDIGYSSVCQTSACVAGQFRCSDGSGCISRSWICDGIHQCSDRSDELMCPGSCGGHLQGILQTFHSPHYPQTYPKHSSCIWRLETPVGTRVYLKFESFTVETLYDKVIIHDGSSEKDPLVGTYSGTDKPSVPYSSSNFYLVIFQSDQDNQMSGFNASFSAVPMDKCGSEMIASSKSQWFGSPNFPNSYPNNILCDWIIKTSNSVDLISLQFHRFSIDTSDFIEIRQGESIDSPLYGRFTGDDIPPVFISTSHSFFIRLYTDFTHTGTGFNATYKTGCNNTILQGYARIMSPGYGITKYPNSINCDWTISDPLQRNLTLVFNNNFDTEKGFDNVTVYTNNHTSYTHAGQGAPPAITTQSEQFHVNFSSDSQVNRNGWAITVSFDCPSLNLSDHLQMNSSITTFGTYVLFYCDNGYQLAGTSVLICDIGGRWSTSPPSCKVINCGSPSIPVNTKLVSVSSTFYLGRAVYKCNSGYKMSTNDTSICQSNRQWTLPYCAEISCPKLDMTEKLMLKYTSAESHYVYGDIVIYDCDSNYRLIGASMVYCTENGTWSKPTPSCKPPVCPPIYIRNGYTNATNIVMGGDYIQVSCNNGYSLTGNPIVFCDLNGVYTALPYCSDINECVTGNVCGGHSCQNTPGSYRCVCNHGYQNPPNSYTVCKDTDECSTFPCTGICENLSGKYRCNCNPPQELYTENIIRIVKRKVLRPNSTCIAVCSSFSVSNGGVIVADTVPLSSGSYIAPTTVMIHCPRGTVPDGSVVVECQLDGTWNNTVTTCRNQECEQLSLPLYGRIFYLNATRGYNSVVQYSCKEGYELSGVEYRFCQPINDTTQFDWTGIEPVCKEIKCQALPDPANGQAVYGSTTVGSVLQYSCNCGYHLIGSKVRICQPGGLWDGKNAICAPSTVCQSPVSSGSVVMSNISPFYTVGTEVNFQCKNPGYQIADTTPIKCVIERPTENIKPKYNLIFEMRFLTPSNFNKSCDYHYVNETVELFKELVEQSCKDPYRPLTTIKTVVNSGDVLQIDLTIQLSEPRKGSFDLVCNCSTALQEIVSTGLIQNNINNVTFNGSEDTTCPTVRLRTADSDNITSTSNWSCDEGYELVHQSEICVNNLDLTCVKSTDCPNVYVSPTTTASTTRITPTFAYDTTTQWNVPISPVNHTTNVPKRSTAISTARSPLETFTMTQTAEVTTVSESDGKIETTKLTSVVQDTTHRTPTVPGVSEVTSTEPSVADETEVTTAIIRTTQMTPTVPAVSQITSTEPSVLNKTEGTTAIKRTTQKTATPRVTTEQQTSDHHITARNSTDNSTQAHSTEIPVVNTGLEVTTGEITSNHYFINVTNIGETTEIVKPTHPTQTFTAPALASTEASESVTTQKSVTEPSESVTTQQSVTEPSESVTTQKSVTKPSESVTTQKSVNKPSESVTTQQSVTKPSESVTTQQSVTEPSESVTTQKSVTEPSELVTTQKSVTKPSESVTTQKSITEPSESITSQKSVTEPSESVTIQKSVTEPSKSVTTQKSVTKPSESVTTQKSVTEPSESVTTQKSVTKPSESVTTQKSVTEPSESITTQKSVTELFPENMTAVVNVTQKFQTSPQATNKTFITDYTTQQYNETVPITHSPQPTPTIPQRFTTETPENTSIKEVTTKATDNQMTSAYNFTTKRDDIGTTSEGRKIFTDEPINTTHVPTQTQDNMTASEIQTQTQIQDNTTAQVPVTQTQLQDNLTAQVPVTQTQLPDNTTAQIPVTQTQLQDNITAQVPVTQTQLQDNTTAQIPVTQTQLQDNTTNDSQLTMQPSITTGNNTENVITTVQQPVKTFSKQVTEQTTQSMTETLSKMTTQAGSTIISQNATESQVSQAVTELITNTKTTTDQQLTMVKTTADQQPTTVKTTANQPNTVKTTANQPDTVKTTANQQPNTVKTTAETDATTQVLTTPGITIPTTTAPNYVIEMTAVLIPANLSQPCKDNINTAISDILSSTEGVSNSLQNSKTCSKYNIKVFIETSINMTLSAVKVTKKYSLVGQSQSILTPCGQDIDDKLLLELRESLSNLPSQTVCLQSLQDSSITVSQWKCSDGYTMDESGEICHIFTLTTDSVTIETTSAVPTTKVTTVVITEPPTTTSSTTTTPTTTTLKPTTRGTTLPPTDPAFYLIQVEAIFTGSNLTWKGCIDATRTQIEEKVESISLSIIQGLKKTWKQCTKQSDIVLLSQTGKIAVTPERLELTAPFAIQSPNVATDIVTDCARNAVEGHIQDKFQGLLREINPGVCFVTLQTFQIPFSSWACNNSYEYDSTSEICRLIQTTTPPPSNALLMAYDIKYFIPHGRLSLSIQFLHLSIQNQVFCLTEYRNRLVSLMQSQTSLFNNGNMVDAKKYCADIYISLYGIDSKGEDVVLSVSPGMLNGQVAVKLFATSSSFTSNGSYNSCIAWIASKLMNVSSHALIGQSTLPSSNVTLCSNVTLDNVSITNRAFNCTTGYQMALYNAYFLCLRDDRTKYIAPFLLSYQWHQPSSNSCIQSLMTRLSAESIPFVQQYAKQPSCASDIILQQNGSITATFISNYLRGNITIAYELSSQTETAGSISTFSSCANTIIQEAKTYFEQKSVEILSSEKVMESCGSTQPVVTMPLISGYYICPSEKTWDQISNQCINAENDTAIIKGTLTSVSSFSVLQTQQFETTSDQSVTSHNIKQNELESTKTTQDQQTFTRNSINSTAKQINEEKISSAQTAPLGTTPNNLEVVTKGKTADTTPNFVDVTFIINTIHSIRIITVDYIPTILSTTKTSITTPATKSTSVTTPTTTETYVTTPATTKTSVTSPATKSTSVTTPATTETSVTTPATKSTIVTTPKTTETSVTTPTTTETYVTTPAITKTSVTSPATKSTSVTTPASTETSVTTPATKYTSVTTPTSTETFVIKPTTPTTLETSVPKTTTTETSVTTPTTTEISVTTPTTTESFVTTPTTQNTFVPIPTTTEKPVPVPTTTDKSVTTPTETETSVTTPTTTETSVTTPTTTETSVATPTTTETSVTTPNTPETSVTTPTTIKKSVTTPTKTEKSVTTPTTTETSVTTPTTTETSVTTPTTTETTITTPTTTETSVTSVQTPITTKTYVTTPTSAETYVTTPSSTKTYMTTSTTLETSEASVATPTKYETTVPTPTITETVVTTPTTTETYVTIPTMTETFVTTPTTTETSVTTLTTNKTSVTTPVTSEPLVSTTLTAKTSVTTAATTYQSGTTSLTKNSETPSKTYSFEPLPVTTIPMVTSALTTKIFVSTVTPETSVSKSPPSNKMTKDKYITSKVASVSTPASTEISVKLTFTTNKIPETTFSTQPTTETSVTLPFTAKTSATIGHNKATTTEHVDTSTIAYGDATTTEHVDTSTIAYGDATTTEHVYTSTIAYGDATTTEHVFTSTMAHDDATTTEHIDTSTIAHDDATTTEHVDTSTIAHDDATTTERVDTSTIAHDDATTTEHVYTSTMAHDDATTTEHIDTSTIAHDDATTTEHVDTSTIAHNDATTTEHFGTLTIAQDEATTKKQLGTSTIRQDDARTTQQIDNSTTRQDDAATIKQIYTSTVGQDDATTTKQIGTSVIIQDDATTKQIDNSTIGQDGTTTTKQIGTSTIRQDDATTTKHIDTSTTGQYDATTTKQIDNSTIGQDGATTTIQIGTSIIGQDDATTTKQIGTSTTRQGDATTTKQIGTSIIGQDNATTTKQLGSSIITHLDATTKEQIGTSTIKQDDAINTEQLNTSALDEQTTTEQVDTYTIAQDNATTTEQFVTSLVGQDNAITTGQVVTSTISQNDAITTKKHGTSTIKQDDAINTEQLNTSALDEQTTTEQVDTYTIAQDNATTTEQFVTSLVGQDNAITTGQVVTSTISQNDAITKKDGTSTTGQDDPITTEQIEITTAKTDIINTEHGGTVTIEHTQINTTASQVNSSSTSDIPYTSTELGDTFRTADKQTTEYTNQSQANTIESTSQPTSIHTPVSSITQTQSITTLQTSTPLKITTALLSTQITTEQTDPPLCYECNRKKNDESCNQITKQCQQGESCQTLVVYYTKKAIITKKCANLCEASLNACDPTDYQTTCIYCCSDNLCNEETSFLNWQDGRKKRKKRSALLTEMNREKRSVEVLTTTTAFWNSSVPNCLDVEPPVFQNCPTKDIIVHKELWGPVFVNISQPTAVDNSGISPKITVTPEDLRQPYLFRENTTVTFTAEDGSGNSEQCEIHVILIDIHPLTIRCPVDVVYVPYATNSDMVNITYNSVNVVASSSATHITYQPAISTSIRIKEHVEVKATAHDSNGNTASCNFTYEATRDDQIPLYKIKVVYSVTNVHSNPDDCPKKYGKELFNKIQNLSVTECNDSFMLLPSITVHQDKLVVDISVMFMNFKTLDFDSMKYCGNLSAQKMIDAGNLTLAPSGCEQLELIFIDEETTQNYLCESNFTVLNRTSKYCTYCNKGTFSNQTSGQCEVCPVTQDSIPTECMACSQDSSVCLDLCKPGEYSPTGLQPCTKCSVGTYTDTYNSTICQSCTPGNSTLSTGTNSLHGCIDECPKGSYSQTGLVPCQPCPQLFYSDKTRSQSCTECPPGQVTPSIGSSSVNQCNDPKVCSDGICNHGSCVTKDNGRHFVCDCLPGFAGAVCDVDIQECDSNPCFNGECVDEENNYSCLCYQGYTGHDCETSINDCSLNTCSNGTCIDGVNSSTCLCYDGFTGDSSCVEKTECDPNPCEHGGLCIDLIDDFICNCSGTGYVGKNCSMLPERCYNGSCLNDGVCHPHVNGYSCSCAQGYTGEYCQINIDECQGHYCRNQAVCIDGVNSYTCLCQPGYNGSYCDYNIMCDTNPCVNGASCQTTLTAFMCDCLPGYSGVLCEVNIDECKQNNCNPDTSQCVDQINGYTCNCLPGWTGEYCDEPTKECLSSPCAHRSQCFDHENQFSCSCVDGYTGHNCSTQVIECDSHPCYNDGQCLDQVNGYKCTCKGSFTGSQCEKHVDLCVGSPCLHNGTCQNLVDTFICKCEVGWTGSRCESLIDNCVSLPCYNNAVCINNINQYTCVCKPGYTGSHCQKDIDECVTDPCLHAGVCTNLIGGYYCTCPDGYTGTDCADLDIPCPSCQNGANKCFNGECVCLPGYIGPDCGKEVNSDYDLYFHGNSRIETGVKRIKNRNQFSLCLWLKTFGLVSSMPVLTLVADNGNSEHEVLSIYNDSIHLSYFSQTEFNLSMTPWSWNHLCVTWDSHMRGHWSVYINGQIQMEGIEFGNGQELPQRQRIVLGQVTADYNSTFHGMISQVNLYDSVLNESEITTGGNNCSISMPTGTVFRWQEFASYVNSETAGVDVIEPSLCGSEACPLGYEGEWCNATEDTEAPTVIYCPEHIQVVTANRLNIVNWTEPQFTDNVGIINIVQTHRSGQVFAYGEYDIMYIAYDTENNTAICSFTVYVIPFNCSLPPPPSNVILTCSSWSEGLQCSVKCQDPRIQSFVEEVPPFYKCGREGFWDPPRGEEFNFPICAEASSPDGTIKGELVYLGPPCTLSSKQILNESFVKNMNNWNMEFGLCPEIGCNFSNITILCMSSGKRRRRSTKSTYNVTFDIPVNGSLMSDGVNALPLTQLETMIKNEEFNTDDFSCDAEKLVVKPYIKCQTGQILVDTYCVNCVRGTYYDNTNELCGVCPRGQYTDQGRQTACKSCDVGYTTESSGTTSSTLCYKSCNIGNYYDKTLSNCKPCERGYYQDETGKTTCKSCGNGKTTENTGSTSVTNCQNSCKAGTELSVSGTCELCAQGTYKSEDSQDTCQPCPYGYSTHKKGATSVQQCSVVSCPPDYKYDSSTQKCIVCPPGYHQPYQGQSSCIPCTYSKFDINIKKCLSGEIDECAIHQDNCDDNADCRDTKDSFECQCKFGFKGNGTTCIDKCIGACDVKVACIIDNSGEPQCKQDTSGPFPLIAVAGGASSFVLIIILIIITFVCRRRSNQKKRKETPHNYQHMDRVHRELEVVTYPRGLPRTVQFRTNPAYSDSELSDPTVYHGGPSSAPLWARPVFPDHEDISKYSETSLKRPLRLRITQEMKNDQQYEIESNKSWHDSSPGSSLSQYRDDTHHSSPNSSISKYRVDSNPKDSSPSSSISHYKEDSLHKNDSPISNKSDFSDSFF